MYETGIITALALILIAIKMDIRKILGYDLLIDILATAFLMFLMYGTYSGMMSALIAGVLISVILYVMKQLFGYKKLRVKMVQKFRLNMPTLYWQEYSPQGSAI